MKNSFYRNLRKYKNTISTNNFLYFLSHAPILKKFFYEDLVGEYEAKEGINILTNTFSYLLKLLFKVIYVIVILSFVENDKVAFSFVFIVLTIGGTITKKIINFDQDDYEATILLKANITKYAKTIINSYMIREFILIFLALLIPFVEVGISIINVFVLVTAYIFIHIVGEALRIRKIDKNNLVIKKEKFKPFIICAIYLLIAFFLITSKNYLNNNETMYVSLISIPFGIYAYYYLMSYKQYEKVFKYNLDINFINDMKLVMQNGSEAYAAKNMNDHIVVAATDENHHGYEYLHSMLLKRYGRTVNKTNLVVSIILFILGMLGLFIPMFITKFDGEKFVSGIFTHLYILIFIMYFLSTIGKTLISICFFQVDRYLINYNFFRSTNGIEANLILRLKTIIKRSILQAIIITVFLALIFIVYGDFILSRLIVVILLPIILSLFFAIYNITMYYLFQPYSFDGKKVNQAYNLIDGAVYIVIYIIYYSEITFNLLSLFIIIVVLSILSVVLYRLVLEKGPKTFRVR